MTKHVLILFGLISLVIVIGSLYFRVEFLENRQKAFAVLPADTIKSIQGSTIGITKEDFLQGNKNAQVTLIEYSDFECPSCQRMHPLFQKLIKQFGSNIRFAQRMFPLPQNKNAEKEAEGALCAGKIGGENMYWNYGNEIYKQTTGTEGGEGFPLDKLVPLAKELGISESTFGACLNSGEMASRVAREKNSGEQAGANQLPSLFIVDKNQHVSVITGEQSYSTLQILLSYTIQE